MLDKAIDFLRYLGWSLLDFIYDLVDTIFEVLNSINTYNIIDTIANNKMFNNFHSGIVIISLTLFGLFIIWKFIKKIMSPDEEGNASKIIEEILKCGMFILLSTFLFAQASTFSIKLAGYTGSIFSNENINLSTNMLSNYVTHSENYKKSSEFEEENIIKSIQNDNFKNSKIYNEKFENEETGENEYKYSIDWLLGILVGAFFLYCLLFSGMILARRQIEFLFLFVISPVVFATSVGVKQRRSAVIEQLVSLILQGAVVMLIISLTAMIMGEINNTTFFENSAVKNALIKSLMFIGCGSFLLTGSQTINRFIGANVSVNSGREQLMSMGASGRVVSAVAGRSSLAAVGASLVGAGLISKAVSKSGNAPFNAIGNKINSFGSRISSYGIQRENSKIGDIGSAISNFGAGITNSINERNEIKNNSNNKKISDILTKSGKAVISSSIQRNYYRRR